MATTPRKVRAYAGNPISMIATEHLKRPVPTGAPATDGLTGEPNQPVESDRETDENILRLARKRFMSVIQAESALRMEMLEDLKFRAGEQWPDQIKTDRTNDKRPIITINRMPQFIKQITNPQRQSRPSIQVNPVGDGADPDTAEVIQGLIRHIESISHADVAYDEAYEDAVVMGRGFFRILTDYIHDGTFDQEILVKRISNPFSVYFDPSCQELDYSDARFAFIVEDVPKDEYESLYGDASQASLELFQSMGDRQPDWFPEGKVRIAEYFWVEEVERSLALIDGQNGKSLTVPLEMVPKGVKPRRVRKLKERKIHWAKINAAEVLQHQIWPGHWIPIVPVLGDEIDLNGQKNLVGIVRYARDPQRMYNYWVSAETEMIALAPKTPFIGAEGQFKGHEGEWKTANSKSHAFLEYVPISIQDKPVPPPQRQQVEPPIRAIVEATKQADNDLKSVIGFYDASLGSPGPDQSGKAILARQKQGETGNANFIDNLGRALWHAGRIYLDLVPHVYDAPRMVHILRADDSISQVQLNETTVYKGVQRVFDVRTGRYNITLSVGPSYQSKRQEAVASMLQLVQGAPQLTPVISDLMVGSMDWPEAKQIAARLKKALPPQFQDDDDQSMPPQFKAQLSQMNQTLQSVMQVNDKVMQLLKSRKMDIDSRERIALLSTQAQVAIAMARFGSEADKNALDREFQKFTKQVDVLHDRMLANDQQDSDAQLEVLRGQNQQAMGAQQAGAQAAQQQQGAQADQAAQQSDQAADQRSQQSDQTHERTMAVAQQAHERALAQIKASVPKPSANGGQG